MGVKGTVQLTGTIRPGDLQNLFTCVSEVAFDGLESRVFKNVRIDQFKNTLSFESAQNNETTISFFDKAFDRMKLFEVPRDKKESECVAEGVIEKRAVGYKLALV